MFFWSSLAFSMIQWMLAIWFLIPLPFLNVACTSGSSQFMYCWSLAWRILSITLLAFEISAILWYFEHSLALPFLCWNENWSFPPVAISEFSKFAGILSAALSQQHLLGFEIALTQWTWVWVNSGSWWWIGRPGVLLSKGSQSRHDWATELNWLNEFNIFGIQKHLNTRNVYIGHFNIKHTSKWLKSQKLLFQDCKISWMFLGIKNRKFSEPFLKPFLEFNSVLKFSLHWKIF